jgi:hypothetical protein
MMTKIMWVWLVPLFAYLSSLILYRQVGRKEILKFDLVQFVYGFVVAPVLYLWLKSMIFVYLTRHITFQISVTEIFFIDSFFSLLFLFIYAFIIIHTLTKSFEVKRKKSEFYDILEHAEYYHLLVTHLVVWGGVLLIFMFGAILNLFLPFTSSANSHLMLYMIPISILTGVCSYIVMVSKSSLGAKQPYYLKLIKLIIGVIFILLSLLYFIYDVSFDTSYILYWFMLFYFSSLIGIFLFKVNDIAKVSILLKLLSRFSDIRHIFVYAKKR